ncbi:hypothetical protein GCM10017687_88430 [Streptomyces echinatus]
MQLHHAVLGLGDLEAEGVEGEVGGEPDVAAAVFGHPGAERVGVGLARGAVHAVGGYDQVVALRETAGVRRLGGEPQLHAQGTAAVLQDAQQPVAAQRGETVAAGAVTGSPVPYVDVVPADEVTLKGLVHDGVGVLDAAERLVGEDHAEAEGHVGGVALPDGDLPRGVESFEQGGGVEPAGATADDRHAHDRSPPPPLRRALLRERRVELGVVLAVHQQGLG